MKTRQVSEFKETEFGKVPVDWEVTELENICERVSVGHVGLTSKFFCGKEEGVLFLRSQNVRPGRINLTDLKYVTYNFHETHKKSQLHEGDLMIVRVGSNRGDCCVVPKGFDKLNCANIVFARPKSEFSSFLGHYFRSHLGKQKLDSISTGSAQGVINTKHIAKLLIPLPLPHQALAISHLLDTLDFKIQNLQNQNKTLEQIAQAIFKSWFVDFDGVTEFEDSELGKIPKGWTIESFGEIVAVTDYTANGSFAGLKENVTYSYDPDYAILVRQVDFNNNWNNDYVYVDKHSYDFLKKSFLTPDDIMVSNIGANYGTVFRVPDLGQPMTGAPNVLIIKCDNSNKEFVYLYLKSEIGQNAINSIVTGSAVPKFNKTDFRNHHIIYPNLKTLSDFHKNIF